MLPPPKLRVCFVGVENHSGEEIGDFKAQIYEKIDQQISQCPTTAPINRRFVEAGLRASRIRPEDLFIQSIAARLPASWNNKANQSMRCCLLN